MAAGSTSKQRPRKSRGMLYTLGIVFCRVVPATVCRMRIFDVVEIGDASAAPIGRENSNVVCAESSDRERALHATHTELDDDAQHTPWLATIQCGNDTPTIVGGAWIAKDSFDETDLGVRIQIPKRARWLFAAYVGKAFRGQGIYGRLLSEIIHDPSDTTTIYLSINSFNHLSLAAHSRFVQKRVGRCLAIRVFGIALCYTSAGLSRDRCCTSNARNHPINIQISDRESDR